MTDTEQFVIEIARLCRKTIDDGSPFIRLDDILNLFEEYFDMKDVLS